MEAQSANRKKLTLRRLFRILKKTVMGVIDDNLTSLGASLAYATLFSIIPFFSLLITIGLIFHVDLANELSSQIQSVVGPQVTEALQTIISNAGKTDSSTLATIVSLGVSIFGATTIFAEIQSSLNTIWNIKAVPKKSWLNYLRTRLLSFSIIIVFAFLMLITFSITNIISQLSERFMTAYPDVAGWMVKIAGIIINIVVTAIIFVMIFKILPDAKIKIKDVMVGAIVTTLLLLVGQWAISLYIGIASVGTVYGAAAFMIVFITWIYYSAIIIYTGAEFTKAWANEMGGKIIPDDFAVKTKVVEVHEGEPQGDNK